jgi:hypothetical protein
MPNNWWLLNKYLITTRARLEAAFLQIEFLDAKRARIVVLFHADCEATAISVSHTLPRLPAAKDETVLTTSSSLQ